jgi:hypothetical protein
VRVRTPGYVLALDIPGMPYSEPTFTSLLPREEVPTATEARERSGKATALASSDSKVLGEAHLPDAVGVAYLITAAQYVRVIGSEGGGIAYADIAVPAEPIADTDAECTGGNITVRTLASVLRRTPWPLPSKRYMVSFSPLYLLSLQGLRSVGPKCRRMRRWTSAHECFRR